MNLRLIIVGVMGVMILGLLLTGCSQSEKDAICSDECRLDGFDYGEYIGFSFCNCFNEVTITLTYENGSQVSAKLYEHTEGLP